MSSPVSIRIPEATRAAIEDGVRRTGRDFSSIANEMLTEAVQMRRIPGVVFVDGVDAREMVVAGSGLAVWEVIDQYHAVGEDWEALKACYDTLSELQLRSALAYAAAYPAEIEGCLQENAAWTPERTWSTHPFTRPPWR